MRCDYLEQSFHWWEFFPIDVSASLIKISKAKCAVAIGVIFRVDAILLPDLVAFMQMAPVSPGKEVCF